MLETLMATLSARKPAATKLGAAPSTGGPAAIATGDLAVAATAPALTGVTAPAANAAATLVSAPLAPLAHPDRRITRSKRLLREAYTALACERGLDGFSVSDVTDRADLNRGTFYAHYQDLPDLLHSIENDIIAQLMPFETMIKQVTLPELIAAVTTGRPPAVAVQLFDVLRQGGALLAVLLSPTGDPSFQARLRDLVCAQVVRAVLHKKYREQPTALVEYYVAYYAAANLGLIQRWLDRGMPEPSEQMARIMLAIMFMRPGDPIRLKGGEAL
jgi:AcrR family transcriptional regulator